MDFAFHSLTLFALNQEKSTLVMEPVIMKVSKSIYISN